MGPPQTANDEPETLSDSENLVYIRRQLDHLDDLVHRIDQRTAPLEQLTPHLDKALHLLDPMRNIRGRRRRGTGTAQ